MNNMTPAHFGFLQIQVTEKERKGLLVIGCLFLLTMSGIAIYRAVKED